MGTHCNHNLRIEEGRKQWNIYGHDSHKGFIIVNEAEVDVFLEFPCSFYDSVGVGNLISGFSAFFRLSLYI